MATHRLLDLFNDASIVFTMSYKVLNGEIVPPETEGATTVQVIAGGDFYGTIVRKYGHMLFESYTDDPANELVKAITMWYSLRYFDIARTHLAMTDQYNPLENYRRHEEGKETRTTGNDSTITPRTKTETKDKVNAYNGGTVESGSSTTEYVAGDSQSHATGTDTLEYEGRVTFGNIGVLTSQSMLQSELDIRLKHWKEALISDFVNSYCYYVGGVD